MLALQIPITADIVLDRAATAATELKHPERGPEHIVLALVFEGCISLLDDMGLTYDTVRLIVRDMHDPVTEELVATRFNAPAVRVIEKAVLIAQENHCDVVQAIHLLAALIASGHINVMQIFDTMYIDINTLNDSTLKWVLKKN